MVMAKRLRFRYVSGIHHFWPQYERVPVRYDIYPQLRTQ